MVGWTLILVLFVILSPPGPTQTKLSKLTSTATGVVAVQLITCLLPTIAS